ncbi:DinB family protein [bacterium]|nr:DinB family protein [bacterium]
MSRPLDPSRLADLLGASTTAILAELSALDEEGSSFRPAEGEWCAKEVVGHLIEADTRGFAGRIREITSGSALAAWDQAGVAAARRDDERTLVAITAEFETGRALSITLLRSLTPDDLTMTGIHPDIGEVAIADIIQEWVFHDRDHLKQMLENTRKMVWPHLGATRRFSELHADD